MADDDFDAPLGLDLGAPPAAPREIPWRGLAFAGIGIVAASLVAFIFITDDGMGGEPFAMATIEPAPPPPVDADRRLVVAPVAVGIDTTPTSSIAEGAGDVETENGVKVIRPGGARAPGARIIEVPDPIGVHLTPAPDRRLVENGRYGPLPKIGADGAKPLDVYARPVMLAGKLPAGAPRIALLVGGMGLSRNATRTALDRLPGAVTLGFAPYGADLEGQVARARGEGHEIVLQVPMESFDDTPAEARPHSLATSLEAGQNIDNLHWLMSRFTGYAGTANFLGAKFTSDQAAFTPILHEIGARGLYYLDDGTSPRSLAAMLAAAAGTPVLQTDLVIDAVDQPQAIEAMLEKLVAVAQAKGSAVGVAAGLPTTVDAIGRFARGLEARGIALVPLSAMIGVSAPAVAGPQ
jgi:polysaccharide deacetylase 2 family uncharacterized protein YibQ